MLNGLACFDVRWLDESITIFRVPNQVPLQVGSWYERREAARFGLYTWTDFCLLDGFEQAGVIAHYRMHNRIEAITTDYMTQQATRPRSHK